MPFKLKLGIQEHKIKHKTGILNALCKNCVGVVSFLLAKIDSERERGERRKGSEKGPGNGSCAVEAATAAIRLK